MRHRQILRAVVRFLTTAAGRRAFRRNRRLRRAILVIWTALAVWVPVTYTDDAGHRHTCLYDESFIVVPCTDGHVDVL